MNKINFSQKGFTLIETLISFAILAIGVSAVMVLMTHYQKQTTANLKAMSVRVVMTELSSRIYSPVNGLPNLSDSGTNYLACYAKNGTPTMIKNSATNVFVDGIILGPAYGSSGPSLCGPNSTIEVHITPSSRTDGKVGVSYLVEVFEIISLEIDGLRPLYNETMIIGPGV